MGGDNKSLPSDFLIAGKHSTGTSSVMTIHAGTSILLFG